MNPLRIKGLSGTPQSERAGFYSLEELAVRRFWDSS